MSETFYPLVDAAGPDEEMEKYVTYPARIAVYDDKSAQPRVVVVKPTDVRNYLEEITATVNRLSRELGGDLPFMVIREIVENLIHAYFREPTISILDGGNTIRFADQGPGIAHKERALEYGTSSATGAMKRYIRGVGSGLPYASHYLKDKGGTLLIEDNMGEGTVVTVSLRDRTARAEDTVHSPEQASSQETAGQIPQQSMWNPAYPQPYGQMPQGYPMQQAPYPGYGYPPQPQNPYGAPPNPYGNPYGMQQAPYGDSSGQPGFQQADPYGQPQRQSASQGEYPAFMQQAPYGNQGYSAQAAPTPNAFGADPYAGGMPNQGASFPGASSPEGGFAEGGAPNMQAGPQPSAPPNAGNGPMRVDSSAVALSERDTQALEYIRSYGKAGPRDLVEVHGLSDATWSRVLNGLRQQGILQKTGAKYALTTMGSLLC